MFPIHHRERRGQRGKKSWRPKLVFVCRLAVVITLVLVSAIAVAQDWVEQAGQEFNCDVLNGILEDYGEREMVRAGARTMTVKEMFAALFFPICPAAGEAAETASKASAAGVALDATAPETLFSFSSEEHGLQPVLGPLSFPAGIYVATLTTDDYMTVGSKALSGDCGSDLRYSLIGVSAGEGSGGAQTVFEVESDCAVMLDVGLVSQSWYLDIVSARDLARLSVSSRYSFSSDIEGLQPVLGPIPFDNGLYIVTVTTDGYMTVGSKILSGDCGSDLRYSLIGVSAGEGSDGAQDIFEVESDCVALLDIGLSDEAWSLDIEKAS